MNDNNIQKKQKPVSASDSFFGMALAQAFMGVAFGPCADAMWEAGEIADAVYEDRKVKKTANGGQYQLGVKNCLAEAFTRTTAPAAPSVAMNAERPLWTPVLKPFAPAMAA
ncbi:MAG: hypothetical protein DI626_02805 [Micavibrio aeruginosavorus]|uniref:Uncharacterized protein n=1 Tax=Micavibrio aeruginosavorus TaxID=349221 RepID=A0A2W5A6B8_9BACT|nr:MAG: hypothetical protein DI626_02805 [Micavibrio aeruginosavorus]